MGGEERVMRNVAFIGSTMALVAVCSMISGCQIPKEKAEPAPSRYVRVAQIDGKYWFMRGDDKFLALGVNVVNPVDATPKPDGKYYKVLSTKYNGDLAAWAKDAEARLRSWNFNTAAGWSQDYLYQNIPLYHTRVLNLGPWGTRDSRLIDVFSTNYAMEVDRTAQKEVAPNASNEYLIGYFANNELPWYGEKGWPTTSDRSMLSRYMRLAPQAPGKVKLVEFLKAYYKNDMAAMKEDWAVTAESFDDLAKQRTIIPKARESAQAVVEWSGVVAEQYFKLCYEAIRRYDPNHLYLGVRFANRAQQPVMAACGKYADVISMNIYRKTGVFDEALCGAVAAMTGKPIMITEFSWRAMENSSGCKNSDGADVTVQTQQDRADGFRTYATTALAQPYLVGYDWFQYHDQPTSGRFDGEDCNYGLVDIHDQPYTTLLAAITEINGRAAELHAQSTVPWPTFTPAALMDFKSVTVRGVETKLADVISLIDASSSFEAWGDEGKGASIDAKTDSNQVVLHVTTGTGWGCGITFRPRPALQANSDGSVNLLGGSRIVVCLSAKAGVKFNIGINESGHGPLDKQTFDGVGMADGEAYTHADLTTRDGLQEYVFELKAFEPSQHHGNQRGNCTIDLDALDSLHLYFPGKQGKLNAELKWVKVL